MRNALKIKEVLSSTLEKHKVPKAFEALAKESPKTLEGFTFECFQELLVQACKISRGVVHFRKTYSGESELVKVFLGLWHEKLNHDKLKAQLGNFYGTFDFPKPTTSFYSAFDFSLYSKACLLVNLLRSCFGMGN